MENFKKDLVLVLEGFSNDILDIKNLKYSEVEKIFILEQMQHTINHINYVHGEIGIKHKIDLTDHNLLDVVESGKFMLWKNVKGGYLRELINIKEVPEVLFS